MEPTAPGAASTSGTKFKSFVSEVDLEEIKKKRQEEWEKVRKAEDPIEAPDEEYDPRSLYHRLQEQKDKKQTEYEEAHKLKNLIRGLDDDEVSFLELVDKTKLKMESKIIEEERNELKEFRKAVSHISEEVQEQQLREMKKRLLNTEPIINKKPSKQQDLLLKAVKRKNSGSGETSSNSEDKTNKKGKTEKAESSVNKSVQSVNSPTKSSVTSLIPSGLCCIGVLPGLGEYSDSSDSDNSSASDAPLSPSYEAYDLVGRRIIHQPVQAKSSN